MNAEDFAYELPAAQIAQHPPVQRDGGRLMRLDRAAQEVHDHRIPELPRLLPAEALVVVNDSRVVPARLLGRRQTGGQEELLLLEPDADDAVGVTWLSMVRSSKRLHEGERIELEGSVEEHHRFLLGMQRRRLKAVEDDTAQLDRRIDEKLEPYRAPHNLLMTIPGVNWHVAAVLIAGLGEDSLMGPEAGGVSTSRWGHRRRRIGLRSDI